MGSLAVVCVLRAVLIVKIFPYMVAAAATSFVVVTGTVAALLWQDVTSNTGGSAVMASVLIAGVVVAAVDAVVAHIVHQMHVKEQLDAMFGSDLTPSAESAC